jgi:hypothetical protein
METVDVPVWAGAAAVVVGAALLLVEKTWENTRD